ncbi:MAG: FAD binding domain-containing protein [Pirellulaceae bacterium]|nr:FAD binding domain-containing protein [Planctomycetales bacterium]
MNNFEYAQPQTIPEAIELLATADNNAVVLAGGTDVIGLMKRFVVNPDRVVNIAEIPELQRITTDDTGNTWIGAAVHLDQVLDSRSMNAFPAIKQTIQGISSIQLQCQGTLVGELLRRPNCWYFRNGHGLLADSGRMVVHGDNRFHAILGNRGAAKFVNPSRLAPALISLGAKVRIAGPTADDERIIDLEALYRTPRSDREMENVLEPGQLVTHVMVPRDAGHLSAAYEVRHGEGPDAPLAAAAVSMSVVRGVVRGAKVVLGQVAPTPWIAAGAANAMLGLPLSEELAARAGMESTAGAMPLSQNEYKIQLAQVAVKRAILRAAGLDTGDIPSCMASAELI